MEEQHISSRFAAAVKRSLLASNCAAIFVT